MYGCVMMQNRIPLLLWWRWRDVLLKRVVSFLFMLDLISLSINLSWQGSWLGSDLLHSAKKSWSKFERFHPHGGREPIPWLHHLRYSYTYSTRIKGESYVVEILDPALQMTEEMIRVLELTPINHYVSSWLSFIHSNAKRNRIEKGEMINAD